MAEVWKKCFVGYSTSTGAPTQFAGVESVEFRREKAALPDAVSGDTIAAMAPGIENADVAVRCRQAYGTGSIEEKLNSFYSAETILNFIEIRKSSTGVSSANPRHRLANYWVANVKPLAGAHGERLTNEFTLKPATGATITRATAT